jgi:hypothetical protein
MPQALTTGTPSRPAGLASGGPRCARAQPRRRGPPRGAPSTPDVPPHSRDPEYFTLQREHGLGDGHAHGVRRIARQTSAHIRSAGNEHGSISVIDPQGVDQKVSHPLDR